MATLEQLRAVFGGTSDEDTLLTASQKLRIPISDIASEVGVSLGGQWGNRFSGSIDNYQAGLYDVSSAATGALGLQGVSDWLGQRRQINERQSEFARQAAKEQGAVTSFKDIGGVGDAFNYLGGLAVDSAPYLGEALAGGLVARGAMTGTRAAMSAARELGMPAAVQAGQRSLARGSVAGAVAASYPSSVGDIMSNQREEAGVTDGATAALLGVPYAAANAFGLEGAAARAGLFRPAVNWFDQAGGIRGGLKRAGVTALTQGAQEGAGETFQEVMNQAGRNAVNPAAGYTNPQAMERYLESFVGGGLLGGVAGAAGGGWRRSEGYKPPVSDNPLNPTDLLVVERGFDARKPLDGFAPEGPRPGSRVMAAPAEVPQWGLARGAMDPAPTHPTVGEATDLFRMPTDGEPRIVGGYDPRLAGLFVGPTQPGAAPFAFSPPLTGTAVPPLSPPVAVDPLGAATGPLYVDDVAEGNNRWREQPADIASPVIGRMESGRQIPISGADDPGLALARQRYEEQLRAAEEQKTKAAELQAQVEAAQARHAANRQAAVDALVDKKPDGSPVVPVRDREIATFTALRELHSAGVIDDATYADLAGRMREAYTLDDKMRPKALNAVAKEVASLKEQANAAGAGTDGAARSADVGRGAGDQRAPGERGSVRPAGAQPAAQGVPGAGTAQLGPAGGRGDGALTGDQIVERIQQLDPVEQAYVGRWLGVDLDDDGNLALREQGAESLRAMEKSLGVSYETVRERVKAALEKLGLPKGMKPKQLYEQLGLTAANTDLETLERNVDLSTPASEAGTGDLDAIVEAADEGALGGVGDTDVRVERAQTASGELVPEIPDQDPMGRQREVAGPIDEGSMDVEDRIDESRALTLDSALEGDVSAGRVTADDITEAQYFYEQNRQRGMVPWGRLDVPMRAAYARTYARARLAGDPAVLATKKALYGNATPERTGTPADADAARGDARGPADGGNVAAEEGGTGGQPAGSEVQAPRGPVVVKRKSRRTVDESWADQLDTVETDADGKPLVRELGAKDQQLLLESTAALSAQETKTLEDHYGGPISSPQVQQSILADVTAYINQRAGDVAVAIRKIIAKLAKAVLSVAVVFNANVLAPNANSEAYARSQMTQPVEVPVAEQRKTKQANTNGRTLSENATRVTNWIANRAAPDEVSLVLDPETGKLYVMKGGSIEADAPALYGKAGVGAINDAILGKTADQMQATDRVTPAGRFPVKMEADAEYGSTITFLPAASGGYAVHRVYLGNAAERRQDRLNNSTPDDNNISYGCVNVSAEFYDNVLRKFDYSGKAFAYLMPSDRATLNEFFDLGDQVQRSRGDTAEDAVFYDRDQLEDDLLTFMNADSLGRHVLIVDDASELTNAADMEAAMDPTTRAWVRGGKTVLIANRIPAGQGRAIFLHEVGSHLGLQRLLGDTEFQALTGKIIGWASRGGNSRETQIAKRAMERVNQAGETNPEQRLNELVAYFIEEAVNAGVNPTALKYDTELGRLLRTLWAAFKVALRKLGVNPDKLTAQDVVDLAYGAARLNVTGRFHGTAAKVQQFRTKYIGTGEGAQAYGWGLYFSELRGVAEDYKKSDVKRKSTPSGNKDAANFPRWAELKEAAKADDFLGYDTFGEMLRAYLQDHRIGKTQHFFDAFPDTSPAHRALLREFGDWWFKPAAEVKGNLYATDIAVREDEMLDWTAPLDQQPETVRQALKGFRSSLSAPTWADFESALRDTRELVGELYDNAADRETARTLLRQLESNTTDLSALPRPEHRAMLLKVYDRYAKKDAPKDIGSILDDMLANVDTSMRVAADFRADNMLSTGTGGELYRQLESLAESGQGPFAPDMRIDDFLDRMVAKYDVMDQVGPNYKRLNSEKLDRAMTPEEAAELRQLQADVREVKGKSAPERVSRWLDSIGVKGVKMPVNYTSGGTYESGKNFVVFNEKNVIRALDNPANRVSRSVQFSMAPPTWTEAFKRWFGNSKVVDERGDPLVVYHGAAGDDFEAFSFDKHLDRESGRKRRYVSYLGRVFYFSPDKREAGDFAMYESDGVGARVVPVYLKTSKPFDMRSLTAKEKIAFADAVLKALPENKKYNFAFIRGIALSYTGDELYNQAADDLGHADKANDILKSMGYDGIISMTGDMGLQYAVFDATQIKSAFNQSPTSDPRIQYSKGRSAADQVAALQQITDKLPQPAKNAWTDIKDFTARKLPYVMTTFQIFEQFGDRLKRLGDMIRANDLMRQESTALQMKVDDIVKRWDKLPKAAGDLLSQVALRATLLGAHPDKAWAHEANAHVPRERQGEYNELRQLYDRLKATSPEGVKLYHDALAAFEDQRQQLEKATERMFEQYGKVMPKVKRVPGPYFPLVRRGDYLAIGESQQLVALKKQLEALAKTEGNDEAIADLNSRIDQLEADGQHFWVSAHEHRSGMENALREYESRGLVGRRSMADQRLGALPTRNLHSTIAALTAEATKNLSKDGAREVGNALAEILLRSLPEGHALERQAARKGVAGAMEDMKRAVAVAGRQNAYYIARLNHAKEVADALHEMGRDAKGDINLEHVYRELEQRHALNMQWHDTPWQDAIGKAAWTWFLGASPAFLAINAAQPWLVSAPVMAGEYGAGAATRELARGTADAFKVLKQARWKDGKFDLWSGIDPDTVEGRFMTRNEKGEQVSEERKALRELIQRGVIDEGLNPELAMYAESGGTGLLTKLSRAFGWPAQQVELVNRVATALAAFRLERAKQGSRPDAYQKALDKAYATVVNTHVDYGAENAPRVMREGGGIPLAKLVFQFRRYQQAMMYLLASNVAKLRNPAEQKMARATLGYLALTSGMAGGVVGLPLAGTVMFLKDLFGDDDDEEGDAKARLRNTLYDLTGDKTLADVLAKGVPTLFGMDIAERAGMGQVAQLFPRLDLSRSKTAEDKLGKTLVAVAGPAGGLAVQGMDAASFFGAGDWVRGTERLLPKMMADPLRAARERMTGQEDRKGEQLMSSEELNYWDTIRRVAGVSSVRESDRFEADRALKSIEQGMNDRRSRIHAEFRRALRSGDFEDVRGMIDEYNADHPDMPVKPKDETAWRKEAQRAVSERDPETGLKVTRRQQPLAEVQRFARP